MILTPTCLFKIISFALFPCLLISQSATISGRLLDNGDMPVIFANVALYDTSETTLMKVETSDDQGYFSLSAVSPGEYTLVATYVGLASISRDIMVTNESMDLGALTMMDGSIELDEAVITAQRAMVEVKADRMVFNVEGTINSVGSDALGLLRKAPGVTVDNNDNINVLGRSGVLLYVDGKRLPLAGEDLSNYLKNLTAEQIDKIDIISSPGAKYEAEGNAGIIDIRLKKADNVGGNATVGGTFTRGRHSRGNINSTGNFRSSALNVFGAVGYNKGTNLNEMDFFSLQNGLTLNETERSTTDYDGYNYRLGVDYFLSKRHTLGLVVAGRSADRDGISTDRIEIGRQSNTSIDSILVANNVTETIRDQNTYNLNYRFQSSNSTSLNVDLDYGDYRKGRQLFQPNQYFNSTEEAQLSRIVNAFETPSEIEISTLKTDYETQGAGGTIGIGAKVSRVISDNTFIVSDVIDDISIIDDRRSNIFKYDEKVYAGYVSYGRPLSESVNLSLGLRLEQTDATGDLQAFDSNQSEPPVELNYLSWFPNAGITYQINDQNTLNLNYGRRINRPDYNVLNPFNFQLSEISFQKGNPFLRPEIVNNIELGYTLKYRYNFKLSYSRTTDQITRLIAPDDQDPRANFITYDNLAEQIVWAFNVSAPLDISDKWSVYTNLSASHKNNQADYGDGAIVDVQVFNYGIYQQHTITLPGGFRGEISGYFDGPGVWGGVFKYDTSYSLGVGLQKKFLNDQLNVRLSVNDLFYQSGWSGTSIFDGLISTGRGNWDSRNGSLSVSYNFGNQKSKSRSRKTGLESEEKRVG